MAYQEKAAWVALIAMVAAFVPYFVAAAQRAGAGAAPADVQQLGYFGLAVVVQVMVMIAGHAYLRLRFRSDATAPLDERDRAITGRSVRAAYYVLITGMILVGCVLPFRLGGWAILNAGLLMIVLAEMVHYGGIVVGYRRQAA